MHAILSFLVGAVDRKSEGDGGQPVGDVYEALELGAAHVIAEQLGVHERWRKKAILGTGWIDKSHNSKLK